MLNWSPKTPDGLGDLPGTDRPDRRSSCTPWFFRRQLREHRRVPLPDAAGRRGARARGGDVPGHLLDDLRDDLASRTRRSFTEPLDSFTAYYYALTVLATVGFGDIAPTIGASALGHDGADGARHRLHRGADPGDGRGGPKKALQLRARAAARTAGMASAAARGGVMGTYARPETRRWPIPRPSGSRPPSPHRLDRGADGGPRRLGRPAVPVVPRRRAEHLRQRGRPARRGGPGRRRGHSLRQPRDRHQGDRSPTRRCSTWSRTSRACWPISASAAATGSSSTCR